MTTDSQKQERRGATVYGGVRNSGSGNTTGHKNDWRTAAWSVEAKTTRGLGYRLTLADLQGAWKNALLDGRDMVFAIDFKQPDKTHRYVVLREEDFLDLINGP